MKYWRNIAPFIDRLELDRHFRDGLFSVVGCRDAEVPSGLVWIRRSRDAQRALVGCRQSDTTWVVECRNASWEGLDAAAGNCSSVSPGNAPDTTLMRVFPVVGRPCNMPTNLDRIGVIIMLTTHGCALDTYVIHRLFIYLL